MMEKLSLPFIADILTVASFIATLWVLYLTRTLSKKFLRRARLPQIKKELEGMSGELLMSMTSNDPIGIAGVFARLDASLESIGGKLPYGKRKAIRLLQKRIKYVTKKQMFIFESAKGVYTELLGVIQFLQGLEDDNVLGAD